jgi:hypothetical protein
VAGMSSTSNQPTPSSNHEICECGHSLVDHEQFRKDLWPCVATIKPEREGGYYDICACKNFTQAV